MVLIDNILFSEEIFTEYFSCNISKCKGKCCVEGESGAPVELEEVDTMNKLLPILMDYLEPDCIAKIEESGAIVYDKSEKKYKTNLVDSGACVFSGRRITGEYYCNIEKAYYDGKTDFKKPISCHLYPIRIQNTKVTTNVNYEIWDICNTACAEGKKKKETVLEFCRDSLIRKFGEEVYEQLTIIQESYYKKDK